MIRLPFRPQLQPSEVAERVEAALSTEALLFMPAVQAIELRLLGRRTSWARRRGQRFKKGGSSHSARLQ